jgi:hypothetical protein
MKNLLLIEHSNAHGEVVYSQLEFLKGSSINLHVILNNKLMLPETLTIEKILLLDFNLHKRYLIKRILKVISENKIEIVVINTAHGHFVRSLCMRLLFRDIRVIGILHEADKINNSFTQKIISLKIKNYLVLSEHILKYLGAQKQKGLSFSYFYPIFYPHRFMNMKKTEHDELLICIPGGIEVKRRDYFGLIKLLSDYQNVINPRVKFILLGNSKVSKGEKVIQSIIENGLQDYFEWYEDYIPHELFYEKLINSDFILPLLHPNFHFFEECLHSKISGAFSLSLAFKKPMLLHNEFKHISLFEKISFFYSLDNLIGIINSLAENQSSIIDRVNAFDLLDEISFQKQQKQYLNFIEKVVK